MSNLTTKNATAIMDSNTLKEVTAIALPEQTKSYMPVSHEEIIKFVEGDLADMLPEYKIKDNVFGLGNKGQYLFGMISFTNGDDYMGPSIAYRNSYNKEFAVGFAFGSQVFICANGMLTGSILVARKHTLNVWDSLIEDLESNIYKATDSYSQMQQDVELMRQIQLDDFEAFQTLGHLRGNNILSPRVFEKALKEWCQPTYEEHKDGTSLQLYNACTEALKLESMPTRAMTQRIQLHTHFQENLLIG